MSDAHDARLQGCRIIKDLRNLGARERGVTGSPVHGYCIIKDLRKLSSLLICDN